MLSAETLQKAKKTIGQSATLTSIGAATGAIMSIMAFLSYMHIDVIPFAWASDIEKLETNIDSLAKAMTAQALTTLALQRDNLTRQLEEAEAELAAHPDSRAAKKEVDRLNQAIRDVDAQIASLKK